MLTSAPLMHAMEVNEVNEVHVDGSENESERELMIRHEMARVRNETAPTEQDRIDH